MIVRLGYVSISNTINVTTSKTVTYKTFTKKGNNYNLIDNVIKNNLHNLIEILKYNDKNNIHFYRLSSSIIPLATHNEVNFNYLDKYQNYYDKINRIKTNKQMRLDMHASNYLVLNSTKKEVVNNSIDYLKYYYNLQKIMGIDSPLVVTHIASAEDGKEASIKRFKENFKSLPKYIQNIIALENDDKTYNIEDIINISKELNIPIILDYHHHLCNNINRDITPYLETIINSWKHTKLNPKMHFSSPLNKKNKLAHNDYINSNDFIEFLTILQQFNQDIDIMIEAKQKDIALFKLMRELKYKTNYKFIDETTFEL